jgi:glycosyltransferase involved in cell wall biosynthesis
MVRLAHLVTHPVQYQAPLFRRIVAETDIQLTVLYQSDVSTRAHHDPGFGKQVHWDVPMLDGYAHRFLPAIGGTERLTFWRPLTYGTGRVLTEGKFDALWISGYLRPSYWSAIAAARRRGIAVLIRDDLHERSKERTSLKRATKRVFFSAFRRVVDSFLAIGKLNREYYLNLGVKPENIFLMPYAVDNQFFQIRAKEASRGRDRFRSELGLGKGRPVILYVGKLNERKRPRDLFDAYVQLASDKHTEPFPYLLFVGDGEQRAELEHRTKSLGWESIRFLGFKSQTEIPAFYDLCDVFVMPSIEEPWGLVVNEAMNAGRAVIASDHVGSAADLVVNDVNGHLYGAGDVPFLARLLQQTLADPIRCRAMGEQSLKVINRWSFEEDVDGLKAALGLDSPAHRKSAAH